MSWSIKLFRLKGIDVRIHLTFVLILIWAGYTWASSTGGGWEGALFGVVSILLLFACVTLHEFGHSLQALAFGARVRDIILLPIGGVSQIEGMPDKPSQELRIALAGPAISFGLSAVFFVVATLLETQGLVTPDVLVSSTGVDWASLPAYLAVANLFLGVFNLIPAFPMDGGRVLRALLAMKMDYRRATRVAANVGQTLAFVFGAWGFLSGNFILILIAFFIWIGAGQEAELATMKGVLDDVTVGEAMTRHPQALFLDSTLSRAVGLTLGTLQSDFPVVDERGQVVGFLTREDLVKGLHDRGADVAVGAVMHPSFPIATPDQSLFEVQQRMAEARLQALPVVDRNRMLIGLLTVSDVGEALSLLSQVRGRIKTAA